MTDKQRPPNQRPIRRQDRRERGFWNVPPIGPVTPRLQQPQTKDAIGFHRTPRADDDQDTSHNGRE
jgi:hypothetical protein